MTRRGGRCDHGTKILFFLASPFLPTPVKNLIEPTERRLSTGLSGLHGIASPESNMGVVFSPIWLSLVANTLAAKWFPDSSFHAAATGRPLSTFLGRVLRACEVRHHLLARLPGRVLGKGAQRLRSACWFKWRKCCIRAGQHARFIAHVPNGLGPLGFAWPPAATRSRGRTSSLKVRES
ncbi:hypothetical protein BX600DRAFT_78523 [Xylariales sp. PMI_506]|nr:hypothetical protein BX600DRAFT_78523 [Xylariales sp. PMI_506]